MKGFDKVSPTLAGTEIVAVSDDGTVLHLSDGRSINVTDVFAVELHPDSFEVDE